MSLKRHRKAVETAIAASSKLTAADEPLLQLARVLAGQMDAAGAEPGSRLVSSYLTAIRTLMTRLGPPPVVDRGSSTLTQIRARHVRPEPSGTARKRATP